MITLERSARSQASPERVWRLWIDVEALRNSARGNRKSAACLGELIDASDRALRAYEQAMVEAASTTTGR